MVGLTCMIFFRSAIISVKQDNPTIDGLRSGDNWCHVNFWLWQTTVVYNSSFRCYGFQRPLNWRIVIEAELAGRLGYLLP